MLLSYIECYSQVSWIYDCIRDIHHESMITVGTKLQQQLSNTITRLAREENPMGLLFFRQDGLVCSRVIRLTIIISHM